MNCKEGDLALIVKGQNTGLMVTCLKYVGVRPEEWRLGRVNYTGVDLWQLDRSIPKRTIESGTELPPAPYASDSCLMPIRPEADPLEEETDVVLRYTDDLLCVDELLADVKIQK